MTMNFAKLTLAVLLFPWGAFAEEIPLETISFERDVMAVLSKAGCNLGTCHGNQHGKGGFRLS